MEWKDLNLTSASSNTNTSNTCDEIPEKQHDPQTQRAVCDMFHKTDMKSSKSIWNFNNNGWVGVHKQHQMMEIIEAFQVFSTADQSPKLTGFKRPECLSAHVEFRFLFVSLKIHFRGGSRHADDKRNKQGEDLMHKRKPMPSTRRACQHSSTERAMAPSM